MIAGAAHGPSSLPIGCLRWSARALSAMVFLFLAGELVDDHGSGPAPTPEEWAMLALFPAGMALGLALGWKWEVLGGAVAIGCLGAFYAVHLALNGWAPGGPWFLIFTAPGFLFLSAGLLARRRRR